MKEFQFLRRTFGKKLRIYQKRITKKSTLDMLLMNTQISLKLVNTNP